MKETTSKTRLPAMEEIESNVKAICNGIDNLINKNELNKADRKELIEELEEVISMLKK